MVDLEYVKKRKKKKIATYASSIATIGLLALIIISFLGKKIGNFTIEMQRRGTELALSTDKSFESHTTFLSIDDIPTHSGYYYDDMLNRFTDDTIDSVESNDKLYYETDRDGTKTGTFFFKYTFYLKNLGTDDAFYSSSFVIKDIVRDENFNYDLSDILRVRVYNNDADSDEHTNTIYAKQNISYTHIDENGQESYDSPVCIDRDTGEVIGGYATSFKSDSIVCEDEKTPIKTGECRRITLVMWLELSDEQAVGDMPKNTSMKLVYNLEGAQSFQNQDED